MYIIHICIYYIHIRTQSLTPTAVVHAAAHRHCFCIFVAHGGNRSATVSLFASTIPVIKDVSRQGVRNSAVLVEFNS